MGLILFYMKLGSFRLRSWPTILMAGAIGFVATRSAPHFHLAIMLAVYGLVSLDGTGLLTKLGDKSAVGTLPVTASSVMGARWALATIAAAPIALPFVVGMAVGGGQRGTLVVALGLGCLITFTAASLSLVGWRFSVLPKFLVALMALSFLIGQGGFVLPRSIQILVQQWWMAVTSHASAAMWFGNLVLILLSLVISWASYPRRSHSKTLSGTAFHVSKILPVEWDLLYVTAITNTSGRYFIGILTLPLMVAFITWNTTRVFNIPAPVIEILSLLVGSTGVVPGMGMMAMTVLGSQQDGVRFHQMPVPKHRVILMGALGISAIGLIAGVVGDGLWAALWGRWSEWIPALLSTITAVVASSLWLMVIAFRFFRREALSSMFHVSSSLYRGLIAILWNLAVITSVIVFGPNHLVVVLLALLVSAGIAAGFGYAACLYQYEGWT